MAYAPAPLTQMVSITHLYVPNPAPNPPTTGQVWPRGQGRGTST